MDLTYFHETNADVGAKITCASLSLPIHPIHFRFIFVSLMCCCWCCCFFWLEVKKEVEEAEKKSAEEEEEEEEDEEEEVYRCGFYLVVWVIWKLFPQKLKLER